MVKKQSRSRSQQSRRRNRSQRSRRQRGGDGGSLAQGANFQSRHTMQHGGSRDILMGAPLDYSGVLEGGMRGAAGLAQADSHFAQAQAHAQTGGSRRRSMRGGGLAPAAVDQPNTLLTDYKGAGIAAPPPDGPLVPYIVTGGDRVHASPGPVAAPMKGGRRQSRRRQSRRRQQSRRRRQRGGYAPVGQASMLLKDYSKAGLPDFKAL
jgi:hypothetical protein